MLDRPALRQPSLGEYALWPTIISVFFNFSAPRFGSSDGFIYRGTFRGAAVRHQGELAARAEEVPCKGGPADHHGLAPVPRPKSTSCSRGTLDPFPQTTSEGVRWELPEQPGRA